MPEMFIISADLSFKIDLRLVPPHEAEMILSDYRRERGMLQPEWLRCSWSMFSDGTIAWPTAEVHGRRTIKRGAQATVKYEADEDGHIRHWPLYVRDAFHLARGQVMKP